MSSYARWKPSRSSWTAEEAYRHRRERRVRRELWTDFADPDAMTLEAIADPERLIAAYHILRAESGHAPGPDGITYGDLGPREVADIARNVARLIRKGRFQPGDRRPVEIPKSHGDGTRILMISNLVDRVVGKALTLALMPTIEPTFLGGSHGFRPARSHRTMLAALEQAIRETGRFELAIDDIRDAFGSIPIDLARDQLRPFVPRPGVLRLVERLVRGGGAEQGRPRGLAQGDPLSPLLLNLVLHHVHDVPIDRDVTNPPWFRYVDNLAYLTQDVPGGLQALTSARHRLADADLVLKGQDGAPVDLRHDSAKLLGFVLFWRDERLQLTLDESSWRALERALEQAHHDADPARAARRAAEGWLASMGPAAVSGQETVILDRVQLIAGCNGFRELSRETLRMRYRDSRRYWEGLRTQARSGRGSHGGRFDGSGGSAADAATGPTPGS